MPTPAFTHADIAEIRYSKKPVKQIAEDWQVAHSVISRILTGETYRKAPGPIREPFGTKPTRRRRPQKLTGKQTRNARLSSLEKRVIACLRFARFLSADEVLWQSTEDGSGLAELADDYEVSKRMVAEVLADLHARGLLERKGVVGERGRLYKMTRLGLDAWIAAGRPYSEAGLVV